MPRMRGSNVKRQYIREYALRLDAIRICTITRPDGKFCNADIPDDAPVSACTTHLREAWSYAQAKLDLADDAQWFAAQQAIRDVVPPLREQRLMDRVRKARSVVYYALAGNYIKIGTTVHLDQRMKDLGANLMAVEPGDAELERDRHRQFGALLAAGREYFFPGHELVKHVALVQERYAVRG